MKVPPTPAPEKAPSYDKDRTATRRSVAGAAGGMRGVDYEDDRRPALGEGAEGLGADRARTLPAEAKDARGAPTPGPGTEEPRQRGAEPDPSKIVREDESGALDPAARRRKRLVARDRLTIDKDAPEVRRKRKQRQDEDDPGERSQEQVLEWSDGLDDGGGAKVSRAHLFEPGRTHQPGDLDLLDPDEIHRALETPLAYAKHCMILGEAFRHSTGATRAEAIAYLGRLFAGPSDPAFGRLALKEFGPSTGIVDIYPLELVEHMLQKYPGFLPKVGFGRFFSRDGERAERYQTDTLTPIVLSYPEELKVRGFALIGGGRPGYLFEPGELPGSYRLLFHAPGSFHCAVSALSRTGHTLIERLSVEVRRAPGDERPPPVEAELYPRRNAKKVAAWPVPRSRSYDPEDVLSSAPADPSHLMSKQDFERGVAKDVEFKKRDPLAILGDVVESDAPIGPVLRSPEPETAPIERPLLRAQTKPSRPSVRPGARGPGDAAPIRPSRAPLPAEPAGQVEQAELKEQLKDLGARMLKDVPPLVARPSMSMTPAPEVITSSPLGTSSSPWQDLETQELERGAAPPRTTGAVLGIMPRAPLLDDSGESEPSLPAEEPPAPPPAERGVSSADIIEVESHVPDGHLIDAEPETARISVDPKLLVADLALGVPAPRRIEAELYEEEDPTEAR